MLRGTVMLSPSTTLRVDSAKHLIRTMAMMGLWFPACGEDAAPGSGSKGEESYSEGEGEGDQPGGEGEGEGEDARQPGADGGQCGGPSGNACQDGFQCGAEAEAPDICTCPQWMEGTWWAEFEPRAVDYEYDFSRNLDLAMWGDQEIAITQRGCEVRGPNSDVILFNGAHTDGRVDPPPYGFYYKNGAPLGEGQEWITFRGTLSEDRSSVTGTCEGGYVDEGHNYTPFHITCTFTLTRR